MTACGACQRGGNGGIFDEFASPHTCPGRDAGNGGRGTDDPPAVALPPRPPSPDVWAWAFIGLILGIGWAWAVFL